jgi:uncharacterized protein YndB with AHSA1/START domain
MSNSTAKATTIKKIFSRETSVNITINSNESTIWELLTDAQAYPKWNSTVISIIGQIALGQQIELKSTLDPKRVFKLKIIELVSNSKLVWGDAMGRRTFNLSKQQDGVLFSMSEKIGGPIFPLFASMIPSFDESFEQFASDLKKAAENA